MTYILPCLITVLIETLFLFILKYRRKEQLAVIVLVNIVTSLALYLLLSALPNSFIIALLLDIVVIAAEYVVYALCFGRSKKLFVLTLIANLITFLLTPIINFAFYMI